MNVVENGQNTFLCEIIKWHRQYVKAFERRRINPLNFSRFYNHVKQSEIIRVGKSAVIVQVTFQGETKNVSHFCPANNREGVELIKVCLEQGILFFVTPDLAPMLEKLDAIVLPGEYFGKMVCGKGEALKKALPEIVEEAEFNGIDLCFDEIKTLVEKLIDNFDFLLYKKKNPVKPNNPFGDLKGLFA